MREEARRFDALLPPEPHEDPAYADSWFIGRQNQMRLLLWADFLREVRKAVAHAQEALERTERETRFR